MHQSFDVDNHREETDRICSSQNFTGACQRVQPGFMGDFRTSFRSTGKRQRVRPHRFRQLNLFRIEGVVFYSDLKRDLFTAGNDLEELYAPGTSLERYKRFWKACNGCLARILISPLVTISAIRGQCPAGGLFCFLFWSFFVSLGCMLSLCCDYRVMTDFGKIGLNEVGLGIPVPPFWGELFGLTIGFGKARDLLLSGTMVSSQNALELGLIHERCTMETLLSKADTKMAKLLKLPLAGRSATKFQMFKSFVDRWVTSLDEEAEWAFEFLSRPKNVKFLGNIMRQLSSKKATL